MVHPAFKQLHTNLTKGWLEVQRVRGLWGNDMVGKFMTNVFQFDKIGI
jgi:hypothetical protein